MKLLLENWRKYLNERAQGRRENNTYIKSYPPGAMELESYSNAVGKEIRGVAKVISVDNNREIKMEYVTPYDNSKGLYRNIDKDAIYEAVQCLGARKHPRWDSDEDCLSEKLSDSQFELAQEFLADLNSVAEFLGLKDPSQLDTSPGNYGFVERNNRMELVMFDLGQGPEED